MKLLNKAVERSFFPSIFTASFLIAVLILGTSCSSSDPQNNQGGTQPIPTATPTADPLLAAQTNFKDKIWTPFLSTPRCANCHDFEAQHVIIYASHPLPPYTDNNTGACTGCHKPGDPPAGLLGFPGWVQAPVADKWNPASDPNTVRAHILLTGPLLFKHLIGEGTGTNTPQVQWAFFNGPFSMGPMLEPFPLRSMLARFLPVVLIIPHPQV